MRKQIVLISMFILAVSVAYGMNSGASAGLDILGSEANNTTILSSEGTPVDVDIIGSTANNIRIGYPAIEANKNCSRECWGCGPCGEEKCYTTPWDDYKRPLCYPWSSYIPTRYSRSFIKKDPGYIGSGPKIIALGGTATYP